jgi:uncharacterized protein YceH (UPF0502 family)
MASLMEQKLAWSVSTTGSRSTKYEHALRQRFELSEQEAAILCELMLRGPQTPGELRARTARLYAFRDLSEVDVALACLEEAEEPLIHTLPRQPGSREVRYAHALATSFDPRETQPMRVPIPSIGDPRGGSGVPTATGFDELQELKAEVSALRSELAALKESFETFRKQLE